MSRRPSLPGAAELFRATGGGSPAPADAAPTGREPAPERGPQRLRAAEPAPERTASVTPLAPGVAPDPVALLGPSPGAPRAEAGLSPAPAAPPRVSAAEPPQRSAPAAYDEEPRRAVARPTGVRQTRRQRMRTVGDRRPTGRERHEEKITVYCSAEELLDLETARLTLRGEHGLVVDRGRIVREAVAIILADLDAKGEDSILVRRFREP